MAVLAGLSGLVVGMGCDGSGPRTGGDGAGNPVASALVGTWSGSYTIQGVAGQATVTFRSDGTVETTSTLVGTTYRMTGTWTIDGDVIRYVTNTCTLQTGTTPADPCSTRLRDTRFSLSGDTLLLTELTSDGTAIQTITLVRSK